MGFDLFASQNRHPVPKSALKASGQASSLLKWFPEVDRKDNQHRNKTSFGEPRDGVAKDSAKAKKEVKDNELKIKEDELKAKDDELKVKDDELKVKGAPKLREEATKNNLLNPNSPKREQKTSFKKEDTSNKGPKREQERMRKDCAAKEATVREESRRNANALLSAKRAGRGNVHAREETPRGLAPAKNGIKNRTGPMFAGEPFERTGLASVTPQQPISTLQGSPSERTGSALITSHQTYRIPQRAFESDDKDDGPPLRQGVPGANNKPGQNIVNDARQLTHRSSGAKDTHAITVANDGPRKRTARADTLSFNREPRRTGANTSSLKFVANGKPESKKTSKQVPDDEPKRSTLSFNLANHGEPTRKYRPKLIDQTTARLVEEIEKKFLTKIPEKQRKRFLDSIFTVISQTVTRKSVKGSKKRKAGDNQEADCAKKPKVEETEKDKEIIIEESTKEKETTEFDFDVTAAAKASEELISAIIAGIGSPMPEFVPFTVNNPDDDDESSDGTDEEDEDGPRNKDKKITNDARRQKMTENEKSETSQKFKFLIQKAKNLAEPLPDDKRKDHDEALDTITVKWEKLLNPPPKDWYKLTPR